MLVRKTIFAAAVLTMCVAAGVAMAKPGNGNGNGGGGGQARPSKGLVRLTLPEGALDTDASGKVDVKFFPERRSRDERSWLRFKLRKLDAGTDYTIWMDDPAVEGTDLSDTGLLVTSDAEGEANLRVDTKHGGTLPFGATLATLAGAALEIRDATGATTVLIGTVP